MRLVLALLVLAALPVSAAAPILAAGVVDFQATLVAEPHVGCRGRGVMTFAADVEAGAAEVATSGQCGAARWSFPAGACRREEEGYACAAGGRGAFLGDDGFAAAWDAFAYASGTLTRA